MHRVLIALSFALLLSACATQFLAAAENDCQRFGFQVGTPEFAQCVEQQYNQRAAAMQRFGAALSAASAGQTYAPPPPQPAPSAPTPYYSSPATVTCFYRSEVTSGFNKICSYDCLGSAYAVTQAATSLCPMTISH